MSAGHPVPLRRLVQLDGDAAPRETRSAACAREGTTVPLLFCASCAARMDAPFRCGAPDDAARTVLDLADPVVLCVSLKTATSRAQEEARRLDVQMIIVVDDDHHAIGVLEASPRHDAPRPKEKRTCGDAMRPVVVSLHASVPCDVARTFLARHALRVIPIFAQGRVIGTVSQEGVLPSIARRICI